MALALYLYIRSSRVYRGRYLNTHKCHRAARAPSTARGCGAGDPPSRHYRTASDSIMPQPQTEVNLYATCYYTVPNTTTTGSTYISALLAFFAVPAGRPRLSVPAARRAAKSANRSWRSLVALTGRPRLIVPPFIMRFISN